MKSRFIGVVSLLVCAGCSSESGSGEELVGVARASVLLAPTDAKCIVIQVQGTTTVSQQFAVTPQQSVVFDLTGLPVGTDTFTAQAFGVLCSAVGTATATYVSTPQTATVAAGSPLDITFQMVPAGATSGSASVGLNFGPPVHGAVTEFPLGVTPSFPNSVTAGPDGNLWSVDSSGNKVWRTTPSGMLTSFAIPTAGSFPNWIAAGPDGNLWFTETTSPAKIGRITTGGTFTEFTVPTPAGLPQTITAGPDGNMWFAEETANKIARITLGGIITEFAVTNIGGLTAGLDGNLWFTEPSGNKIARMTTGGTITEFAVPTAGSVPVFITTGSDGNLWFDENTGNKIGRLTTTGTFTEFTNSDGKQRRVRPNSGPRRQPLVCRKPRQQDRPRDTNGRFSSSIRRPAHPGASPPAPTEISGSRTERVRPSRGSPRDWRARAVLDGTRRADAGLIKTWSTWNDQIVAAGFLGIEYVNPKDDPRKGAL